MITTTGEYALRGAVFLAQNSERPWTAEAVARRTHVPPKYMAKVLQQLARAGLIRSQRGVGGGFALDRDAREISVLDVLDATDNPLKRIERCPLGLADHVRLCVLHRALDDAVAEIRKRFGGMTLAAIAARRRGTRPMCEDPPARVQLGRTRPKH